MIRRQLRVDTGGWSSDMWPFISFEIGLCMFGGPFRFTSYYIMDSAVAIFTLLLNLTNTKWNRWRCYL